MGLDEDALDYHSSDPPGKIAISTTKPTVHAAGPLAGVLARGRRPRRAIDENPDDAFTYTARGNPVAVVSDGSATLGLGDIGPAASQARPS